ncbi:MAG TPA: hypothetical protein VG939_11185 [Caulobacteraceae bacterium]|nr:hypothetical protein [Caulobacteraceae bacterium]
MNLSRPPADYDPADQRRLRAALEEADRETFKRGRDLELGAARLILTDTVTGARYALTVASGVVTLVLA